MNMPKATETIFTEQLGIEVMWINVLSECSNVTLYELQDGDGVEWYTVQTGDGPVHPEMDSWDYAKRVYTWAVKAESGRKVTWDLNKPVIS